MSTVDPRFGGKYAQVAPDDTPEASMADAVDGASADSITDESDDILDSIVEFVGGILGGIFG